jgi:hypothetical protein
MGLDCTVPWGDERAAYERGQYRPVDLTNYLGQR